MTGPNRIRTGPPVPVADNFAGSRLQSIILTTLFQLHNNWLKPVDLTTISLCLNLFHVL